MRASLLSFITLAVSSPACLTAPRRTLVQTLAPLDNTRVEADKRININAASARELETLPDIGKVIAERIVTHRERFGPFRRPEHLMMVAGVSDRKFRALRELIILE